MCILKLLMTENLTICRVHRQRAVTTSVSTTFDDCVTAGTSRTKARAGIKSGHESKPATVRIALCRTQGLKCKGKDGIEKVRKN